MSAAAPEPRDSATVDVTANTPRTSPKAASSDALGGLLARTVAGRAPHRPGCGCAGCALSGGPTLARAVLQRCVYCGQPTCQYGEKCGGEASFGGLFDPMISPRDAGVHKDTKKSSKRGAYESEHMVPWAVLKQAPDRRHGYNEMPAMSIPYEMHRGAVSGAGHGVTSTGSSATAKEWAQRLGEDVKAGNWEAVVRKSAMDEYNAAWNSETGLSAEIVNQIMQVVNQYATLGYITPDQAGTINNAVYWRALMDRVLG